MKFQEIKFEHDGQLRHHQYNYKTLIHYTNIDDYTYNVEGIKLCPGMSMIAPWMNAIYFLFLLILLA